MGFKCGIVGLPNVGKSTLFNALTNTDIPASNYPFCTIDPNVGMVPVPDPRLDQLASIVNPQKILPTLMQFVDIAGLVKGAAEGEGLGNQFLSHIRETDAIAHVVRCFEDPDVIHVDGKLDPIADIETIHTELALADLDSVTKALQKLSKKVKAGDKDAKKAMETLARCEAHLSDGQPLNTLSFEDEEQAVLKPYGFITLKPILYVANTQEGTPEDDAFVSQVRDYAATHGASFVALCAQIEAEIAQIQDPNERAEFLSAMDMSVSGLELLINAGYQLLGLQTYFTAGEKEVRAWTIPIGATAQESAGVIHTDFARGFIRAEVIAFEDYIAHKGEQGAKEAGRLRVEGKGYVTQDGDVMHFRFNV